MSLLVVAPAFPFCLCKREILPAESLFLFYTFLYRFYVVVYILAKSIFSGVIGTVPHFVSALLEMIAFFL